MDLGKTKMSNTFYTIQEATQKLCPTDKDYCLADACMKWEWLYKRIPGRDGFMLEVPKYEKTNKGYCNL